MQREPAPLLRRFSGDIDEHVIPVDLNRKRLLTDVAIQTVVTIRDIKLPSVPRTGDNPLGQGAFSKRTASVRTDAIESMNASLHVEQSNDPPLHGNLAGTSLGQIRQTRNLDRLAHDESLSNFL